MEITQVAPIEKIIDFKDVWFYIFQFLGEINYFILKQTCRKFRLLVTDYSNRYSKKIISGVKDQRFFDSCDSLQDFRLMINYFRIYGWTNSNLISTKSIESIMKKKNIVAKLFTIPFYSASEIFKKSLVDCFVNWVPEKISIYESNTDFEREYDEYGPNYTTSAESIESAIDIPYTKNESKIEKQDKKILTFPFRSTMIYKSIKENRKDIFHFLLWVEKSSQNYEEIIFGKMNPFLVRNIPEYEYIQMILFFIDPIESLEFYLSGMGDVNHVLDSSNIYRLFRKYSCSNPIHQSILVNYFALPELEALFFDAQFIIYSWLTWHFDIKNIDQIFNPISPSLQTSLLFHTKFCNHLMKLKNLNDSFGCESCKKYSPSPSIDFLQKDINHFFDLIEKLTQ